MAITRYLVWQHPRMAQASFSEELAKQPQLTSNFYAVPETELDCLEKSVPMSGPVLHGRYEGRDAGRALPLGDANAHFKGVCAHR